MKKIIIWSSVVLMGIRVAYGQRGIGDLLMQVEQASTELQARRDLTTALKTEARTGNYLANPTVEFESLWGGADPVNNSELTVLQPFDFPTVYGARNKLAKVRASLYDSEGAAFRQQLLLDAKLLCVEVVYLHQVQAMLSDRLVNAQRQSEAYGQKLESGDANKLEYNKVAIELIAAKTEYSLNEAELQAKRQQLARLTGNPDDRFADLVYPQHENLPPFEQLSALYLDKAGNPELAGLENERTINDRTVSLNRALSLPRFEVGYRHDFGDVGRFKGFKVGMSIPMFENKNRVKAARAQRVYAQTRLESARQIQASELKQLYDQATTLKESIALMESVHAFKEEFELLDKALNMGQISLIQYVTEIGTLYQSRQLQLQLERDYQQIAARIFRFVL